MKQTTISLLTFVSILLTASNLKAVPLSTAFTYQGQLKSQGVPLTGTVDLEVSLFDIESGGIDSP